MCIEGKRILFTHTQISNIMGSTVVAAEVTHQMCELGADVTLFSASFAPPAAELFDERVKIVIDENAPFHIADFDYIWVHSQVLPLSIVRELREAENDNIPPFIFNHMSMLPTAPDEHPYIEGLDDKLASLELFVSQEVRDALSKYYKTDIPGMLFPNPAPDCFAEYEGRERQNLEKLVIVSNHVPAELLEARDILIEQGHQVDVIGEGYCVEQVSPQMLDRYDAVITIGKTVQYCLVQGVPVYVYDRFGGYGWFDEGNIDHAARYNFSGRQGEVLDGAIIAEQVMRDWANANDKTALLHEKHKQRFALGYLLPKVFDSVRKRDNIDLDDRFLDCLEDQERFAIRYYRAWDYGNWFKAEKTRLDAHIVELERDRQLLRARCDNQSNDIQHKNAEIARLQRELLSITSSKSYQIGRAATAPARAARIFFDNKPTSSKEPDDDSEGELFRLYRNGEQQKEQEN